MDLLAVSAEPIELYRAFNFRKQRVVAPHPDILARVDSCAELPDDDGAGTGRLAAEQFYPASLAGTISAVARASLSLFMSHLGSSYIDSGNAYSRLVLAVPLAPTIFLAAFLLKHQNFLGSPLADDFGRDTCACHGWGADLKAAGLRGHQYLVECQLRARIALELLNSDDVARCDAVLLPTGLNDSVVHGSPCLRCSLCAEGPDTQKTSLNALPVPQKNLGLAGDNPGSDESGKVRDRGGQVNSRPPRLWIVGCLPLLAPGAAPRHLVRMELTVLTRRDCALCGEMEEVAGAVIAGSPVVLRTIDVDSDADLRERYGQEVPVLLVNGRKAFKYRVSESELRNRLRAERRRTFARRWRATLRKAVARKGKGMGT